MLSVKIETALFNDLFAKRDFDFRLVRFIPKGYDFARYAAPVIVGDQPIFADTVLAEIINPNALPNARIRNIPTAVLFPRPALLATGNGRIKRIVTAHYKYVVFFGKIIGNIDRKRRKTARMR